jgi:lactose/L-arabinose transport system ATP-binding protein
MELVEGDAVTLDLIEHLGGVSYIHLVTRSGQRLIAEARNVRGIEAGSTRDVAVLSQHLYLFDPETGRRLR